MLQEWRKLYKWWINEETKGRKKDVWMKNVRRGKMIEERKETFSENA